MRVMHVANVRWYNATAWYAATLAGLQAAAGHEVTLLGVPGPCPALEVARREGVGARVAPLNSKNPLVLATLPGRMAALLAELRPQAVVCHRGEAFPLWALLRRTVGGFTLLRVRGDARPPKAGPVNRLLHARAADAVVATNSAMESRLAALGVPASRRLVIEGGVDTVRFAFDPAGRERVRAELGYGPEHTVVGLAGRFDPVKGQRQALEALARLRAGGRRGLRLMLLGFASVTSEAEVRGWVREMGLEDAVAVTGRREDVAACLSACDLGLVNSMGSEAIARAALEWMASRRPVLATRVGVLADLFEEDALLPPGDVEALAAGLAQLVDDVNGQAVLLRAQDARLANLSLVRFRERWDELLTRCCGPAP